MFNYILTIPIKEFVKDYLHRSFIIIIYINPQNPSYIPKLKDLRLTATVILSFLKPKSAHLDLMFKMTWQINFKSQFTRLEPYALITPALL